MSDKTKIQWCDSTVNFWSGCTKVSAGCAHCYAEKLSNRNTGNVGKWGKGTLRKLHNSAIKLAHSLNKKPFICEGCGNSQGDAGYPPGCPKCGNSPIHRRRIFSLSLGDWLDSEIPLAWLEQMLGTIRECDQVIWILVTKRPELFRRRLQDLLARRQAQGGGVESEDFYYWVYDWVFGHKIPPHIWVLASVENQDMADKRIPELLKIPAVCHGLSLEPLLEPVNLDAYLGWSGKESGLPAPLSTALESLSDIPSALHWLIIGCESGPKRRDCDGTWMGNLVDQGKTAGVPTFVKQILVNGKVSGNPSEWPIGLQIRQFPSIPAH